ncbi:MAG: hypothetical protein FWD68_14425 [Alphaproteobacteria bacterium]|nr:hypothetical protein [Alphaproteobacteria bacterium]
MERPSVEIVEVGELSDVRVRALMVAPEISDEVRNRLAPVAEAARAGEQAQTEVKRMEQQRQGITSDQDRLRENLKAAPPGSDLALHYSQKMLAQEKVLEETDEALRRARGRVEAAQKLLIERVGAL